MHRGAHVAGNAGALDPRQRAQRVIKTTHHGFVSPRSSRPSCDAREHNLAQRKISARGPKEGGTHKWRRSATMPGSLGSKTLMSAPPTADSAANGVLLTTTLSFSRLSVTPSGAMYSPRAPRLGPNLHDAYETSPSRRVSPRWSARRCGKRGRHTDNGCELVLVHVQQNCSSQKRSRGSRTKLQPVYSRIFRNSTGHRVRVVCRVSN